MIVLLSAFACDPSKGSEPFNGWNWASGLAAKGFEIHCLTRDEGKKNIESKVIPANLYFHYVVLPFGMEKLYAASTASMYLYYLLWQWAAYKKAKQLHRTKQFTLAHHVTWGSIQLGSFMYRLGIPFIFGPAGGGQKAPENFKKYFLQHWATEQKREKISAYLARFSPACKNMVTHSAVIAANDDTLQFLLAMGANNAVINIDTALPDNFYPVSFIPKNPPANKLQLLWVGRFLPRKGILLILDVMKELKMYSGITLTIVGDGEMREPFLEKLAEYKLEETVNWKGSVPFSEVRDFYASHDVFFFTSLRDSSPAQFMEAMAFGLPIVTINLHGQALLVNNETGIKCACDTPEMAISELKKALLYLYNNNETVSKMSKAAHEFALLQNWTNKINNTVTRYYKV